MIKHQGRCWVIGLLACLAVLRYVDATDFAQFDNEFDQDDSDTPKWRASAHCIHIQNADGAPTGPVFFDIIAIENDPGFEAFEACKMVDYNDLLSDMVTTIDDAGCNQPMSSGDPVTWEFAETIADATTNQAVAGPDSNSACGAYKDGTTIFLGMYCYRKSSGDTLYLKRGDSLFLAQCDAAAESALVNVLIYGGVNIDGPPMTSLIRRAKLTFVTLEGSIPPDDVNDVPKTTFTVGDPGRLKICIEIDSASGDTRTEFADGLDAMGVVVGECTAKRDPGQEIDGNDATDTDIGGNGVIFISSVGCGLGAVFATQKGVNDWGFYYVKASDEGDNAYLRSKNCFYTESFEVRAFLGKFLDASDWKTLITCKIKRYCVSSTDTACFGDKSGKIKVDGSGYPTCPAGDTGKRKRSVYRFSDNDLPETVNTTITIRAPSGDASKGSKDDCFTKKSTFFAVTGVLACLILLGMACVAALFYKVISGGRSNSHEKSTDFRSSTEYGSHPSKSGYQNSAFSGDRKTYYR